MPTNFTQLSFKATGGTTSRTFGARWADVYNVKDFGAYGDGVHNDGASIQATLDAVYGPAASPHGNSSSILNKGVYIPKGTYLVDQQLFLNFVQGAWVFGDGQKATRLVYTGPDSQQPSGFTSILTCRTVTYSSIEGITFDATSSNAVVAVCLINWVGQNNDGTGNTWTDCGFVGTTADGFLSGFGGSNNLGSEQLFIGCSWDTCSGFGGVRLAGDNALDFCFVNCKFSNCTTGISCVAGAINSVVGCSFHNNSVMDVYVKEQQGPVIIACESDSANFCSIGPGWIAGCTHTGSGTFWIGSALDTATVVIEGCRCPSGTIGAGTKIYLRGNTFGNAGYLTAFTGFGGVIGENI